jgi:L-fuconolactonase
VTPDDEPILDAHVHFWDPRRFDYPWLESAGALNRTFLPEHLPREGTRRREVLVVQADCRPEQALAEVEWVRGLREAGAPIVAAVAHAPLEDGVHVEKRLGELAASPFVAGVRRLLQDEGEGFAVAPGFLEGAELLARTGMPLDMCLRRPQLAEATELVRRRPELTFVLDHLGKPKVSPGSFRSWARDLRRLAGLPNVTCKLSGLATEAEPGRRTPAHLVPFLRRAIDLFGPRRCMFGSDWPVLTTAMSYARWLDVVDEATSDLTAEERDHIMRRTALGVYGIEAHGRSGLPQTGRHAAGGTTSRRWSLTGSPQERLPDAAPGHRWSGAAGAQHLD